MVFSYSNPGDLNEDEDGRNIFVDNVLDEVKGNEYRLSCDMRCSSAFEKIVRICTPVQLATLFNRLTESLDDLVVSRCGSHVLQVVRPLQAYINLYSHFARESQSPPVACRTPFCYFCQRGDTLPTRFRRAKGYRDPTTSYGAIL